MNTSITTLFHPQDELQVNSIMNWLRTELFSIWNCQSKQLNNDVSRILKIHRNEELMNKLYRTAYQTYMQKIKDNDHCHAYYQIGYYHQHGLGIDKKDSVEALRYYEEAIKRHHHLACHDMSTLYDCDSNIDHQESSSIQKIDEKQLIDIKVRLLMDAVVNGQHYYAGKMLRSKYNSHPFWRNKLLEIKDDIETAIDETTDTSTIAELYNYLGVIECFIHASQTDDDNSDEENIDEDNLTTDKITSVDKTTRYAYDCFQKAAKLGDGQGYFNYAFRKMLSPQFLTDSSSINTKEANLYPMSCFIQSAIKDHPLGWFSLHLALNLQRPDNVDSNRISQGLLIKAAKAGGFSDILRELAYTYLEPRQGWQYDHQLAREYLERALTANPSCLYPTDTRHNCYLGYLYQLGVGTGIDKVQAAHYYAATLLKSSKCPITMVLLAKLIEKETVPRSTLLDSVRLYQSACLKLEPLASAYACYRLGRMCSKGLISHEMGFDTTKASFYYQMANKLLQAVSPCPISYYIKGNIYSIDTNQENETNPTACYYAASEYYNRSLDYRYYAIKAKLKYEGMKPTQRQEIIQNITSMNDEIQNLWQSKPKEIMWSSYRIALRYLSSDFMTKLYDYSYRKYRQKLQESDDMNVHYQLGYYFRNGLGSVKKDPAIAMNHYYKAVALGHSLAYHGLALLIGCEEEGDDPTNYCQVYSSTKQCAEYRLDLLLQSAYMGNINSLHYIDQQVRDKPAWSKLIDASIKTREKSYRHGKSRKLSHDELTKLQVELGILLMIREAIFDQPNSLSVYEIINHFNKAAKLHDPAAYYYLGYLKLKLDKKYFKGSNKKNDAQAYLMKAAKLDYIAAKLQLVQLIFAGEKLTMDDRKVRQLLIDGSKYGDALSTLVIALGRIDGRFGIEINLDKAISTLERAMVEDHHQVIPTILPDYLLGIIYECESTCTNKYIKARHWYSTQIVHQLNDCQGRILLGQLIEKKKIPAASILDAIKLYQSAIYINDQHVGVAHYRLGKIYSNKQNNKFYDLDRAKSHFRMAYRQFQYNVLISSKNASRDCYILAKMYKCGYGTNPNSSKAMLFYQKTIDMSKADYDFVRLRYRNKAAKALQQSM
ncbi:hypothetical protein TrispH2_009886 [Trichoplax sp. H2]|nr:hypothetical protein TrispH2_009886 [Trichoplax sp. H2]|eukprot:RDD38254.1 hypothetical protein TrispH2_009886 [Trichoplax sp. H2]